MRKFYKHIIQVEVLTEDSKWSYANLSDINYDINEGDCVGSITGNARIELTEAQAAEELRKMGSEPGFFGLKEEE